MTDDERQTVSVRINATQYELLRRRCLSEGLSFQQVLAAGVNAFVLGDLRLRPNGRYYVEGPARPLPREDAVTVRAPTTDQPERAVTLAQPPTHDRTLGTSWLVEHVASATGHRTSPRMMRRLLAHLEDTRRIEPRSGRYWKFSGYDDPTVAAVIVAIDDGTWDEVTSASMSSLVSDVESRESGGA